MLQTADAARDLERYGVKMPRAVLAAALLLIILMVGCVSQPEHVKRWGWKEGQLVEVSLDYATSKFGNCSTSDGKVVYLRGDVPPIEWKRGSQIWVRGVVEYQHLSKPDDYRINPKTGFANYQLDYPVTLCYIRVSKFKVLKTP